MHCYPSPPKNGSIQSNLVHSRYHFSITTLIIYDLVTRKMVIKMA